METATPALSTWTFPLAGSVALRGIPLPLRDTDSSLLQAKPERRVCNVDPPAPAPPGDLWMTCNFREELHTG